MNIFSMLSCQSQNFHLAPAYNAALPFKNGIAAVQQGQLWGFIDTSGNWVFEPRFTSAVLSPEGEYLIEEPNVIYIEKPEKDSTGKWILKPHYYNLQEIQTSTGIRIIDYIGNSYALFDEYGNQISRHAYDSLIYIGEDLFVGHQMYKGDQLLNAKGDTLTTFYTEILPEIISGRIKFKNDRYSGLLTLNGKVKVAPEWWLLEIAGENIACTHGGNLKLYTDNLQQLSAFEFNTVQHFENGNWIGRNTDNGESKLFNPEGKVILENLKFGHGGIQHGLIPAEFPNNQWGYLDENGKSAFPFQFSYAESFMPNGFAIVWKHINGEQRKLLIDLQGREITTPPFDNIEWHKEGVYRIEFDNKNQLLDNRFQPITDLTKAPLEYVGNGVYIKYKVSKSLAFQKSNFYTGDKMKLYISRDYEFASLHSIHGDLLINAADYNEEDLKPMVSEGFVAAKKRNKWGFIRCADSNME
jgi:hypothetical protein